MKSNVGARLQRQPLAQRAECNRDGGGERQRRSDYLSATRWHRKPAIVIAFRTLMHGV